MFLHLGVLVGLFVLCLRLVGHAHNASHSATHHDCSVHVFWLTWVYVNPTLLGLAQNTPF